VYLLCLRTRPSPQPIVMHLVLSCMKGPILWSDWSCKIRIEWKEEEEEEKESNEFFGRVIFQVHLVNQGLPERLRHAILNGA
jgi:hypothetical protein